MNATTFKKGQAHRAAINTGINTVATTVGATATAVASYFRGVFTTPPAPRAIAGPKPAARAAAKPKKSTKK